MRTVILLCGLILGASTLPAFAGKESDTLTMTAKARVDVDAEGRVTEVAFLESEKMIAAVREPLARAIRSWEFEPAKLEDRTVSSTTTVTVGVLAERLGDEDAFVLRISSASAGPGTSMNTPPRYPPEAVRAMIDARIVLRVSYDESGKTTDVETLDLALSRERKRTAARFEEATHEAVSQWHFIPEVVDGRPIAGSVQVPVSFCIKRSARQPSCFEEQKAKFPDGTLLAEQPATRLRTEVVGTRL